MEKYPDGKIHIINSNGKTQYYLRTNPKDKSGKYISKDEHEKIKLYVQKKYDEAILSRLKLEKTNLEKFLKKSIAGENPLRKLYSDNPQEIKNLIIPIDISDKDYIDEWMALTYEKKEISQNVPVYITAKGEAVRSKSELTIANTLEKYRIPYKYECPVILSNGQKIHPDFTILQVKKRKVIYWEHRGMMDDRDYARHSVRRLKELDKEGIVLGDNLIITEETSGIPLGTDEIEKIIKRWFI